MTHYSLTRITLPTEPREFYEPDQPDLEPDINELDPDNIEIKAMAWGKGRRGSSLYVTCVYWVNDDVSIDITDTLVLNEADIKPLLVDIIKRGGLCNKD